MKIVGECPCHFMNSARNTVELCSETCETIEPMRNYTLKTFGVRLVCTIKSREFSEEVRRCDGNFWTLGPLSLGERIPSQLSTLTLIFMC